MEAVEDRYDADAERASARAWLHRWRGHHVAPVEQLVALKAGATVSVVIPALDEQTTVAGVVGPVRELVEQGLVDELIVVDGGSSDDTRRVAEDAGARIVDLPAGAGGGKGGALRVGLAASSGDLLVFLDADVSPSYAQTVTSLLSPLLQQREVSFVKAAFDRPLVLDGVSHPGSGGRVTELMARPLLNAWWPALSGFVQPLSGELAVRRDLLAQVGFADGYAVEIAMLVDVLDLLGLEGMAQVDIGERIHRHHPDADLGRMASAVLLAAVSRRPDFPMPNPHLLQLRRLGEGWREVESTTDIGEVRRP